MERWLAEGGPAAILKVGRRIGALRALIGRLGLLDRAVYVGRASLADQTIAPLADAPDDAPYFSMILIRSDDPHL